MLILVFLTYLAFLVVVYKLTVKSCRVFQDDLFNPVNILYIWYIVELPYLLWVAITPDALDRGVLAKIGDIEFAYAHFMLMKALWLGVYCTSVYVLFVKRPLQKECASFVGSAKMHSSWLFKSHLFYFICGVILYFMFVQSIGGIFYLWDNMAHKTTITSGTGHFRAVWFYMLILSLIFAAASSKVSFIYYVSLVIIIALLAGSLGDRSPILKIILIAIFSWGVFRGGIRLRIGVKESMLVLLLGALFILIPIFRTPEVMESIIFSPDILASMFQDTWHNLLRRFSDINRGLFVFSHFNFDNFWLGKSYIDLLYAPIPRGMLDGKPPIDDGFYLYSLYLGWDVEPPASFENLYVNSWPFTSMTIGFANFGYAGVFVNAIILSLLCSYAYRLLHTRDLFKGFIAVFLYTQFVCNVFQLTNHGLVNSVLSVAMLSLYLFLSKTTLTNKL